MLGEQRGQYGSIGQAVAAFYFQDDLRPRMPAFGGIAESGRTFRNVRLSLKADIGQR